MPERNTIGIIALQEVFACTGNSTIVRKSAIDIHRSVDPGKKVGGQQNDVLYINVCSA